jgi:uncharacterized membrane protein YfcA
VCGFAAGVLQIVPIAKTFSCCFILPLAAFFSLILDQRANRNFGNIPMKKALTFGLITGLYAALFGSLFDILITLITKQNEIVAMFPELQKMITNFPLNQEIKKQVLGWFEIIRNDILNYGFSPFYTMSVVLNNIIVDPIFGIVGGMIGAKIINRKNQNTFE